MALTDQPYLPFFVDDWMNNTKLKECSPGAHGVMVSIMCLMHKSEHYGILELKAKYKQSESKISNFALYLHKVTCFEVSDLATFLNELIENKVLIVDEDRLISVRMLNDGIKSTNKAAAGSKGGRPAKKIHELETKHKTITESKKEANTGIGIGIDNDLNEDRDKGSLRGKEEETFLPPSDKVVVLRNDPIVIAILKIYKEFHPEYVTNDSDYPACREIAVLINSHHKWHHEAFLNGMYQNTLVFFRSTMVYAVTDSYFGSLQLPTLKGQYRTLISKMIKKSNGNTVSTPTRTNSKSAGAIKLAAKNSQNIADYEKRNGTIGT